MNGNKRSAVSLRKRWLLNTAGVVFALGLVCVLVITAAFSANYYSNMSADMHNRAKTAADFFKDYNKEDFQEFYQSCITYTQTFEGRNLMELQFLSSSGEVVASSYGLWAGPSPATADIADAISTRGVSAPFVGCDPDTGERVMAVSVPVFSGGGEVVGVLRFVTSTALMDRQIVLIALVSALVLAGVLPLVVGITYELNRWAGRHDNGFTRFLTAPGMFMQRFTTNEPDDGMIEVGIASLTAVLPEEEGSDRW